MNIEVKSVHGRKEILTIFLDGEKWKDIHTAIFGKQPKFPPSSSETEWESAFNKYELQRTKNYVIWRLSSQPYHSEQLKKLLKERFVSASSIDQVIGDCVEKGFIDDELWVENFVKSHRKRLGLPAIMQKLRAKGLGRDEIGEIQEQWRDPDGDQATVQHLLITKYRNKDLKDYREKQKVVAALMRKGFPYELIKESINSFFI